MQLLTNAVSDYPETEVKTILKGMTLAMAAITSAYEKSNSITDGSLRREVIQWLQDKDFGVGLNKDDKGNGQRRVVIRNEDKLREDLEYYKAQLSTALSIEECRETLRTEKACGEEFGLSVSGEWPDKCVTFCKLEETADESVFEYIGIAKC